MKLGRLRLPFRALCEEWLARRKRKSASAQIIAVTGSSAKSTTTLLLAHILASTGDVRAHAGYNGHRNVVRALLGLKPSDRFFVVEAAAGLQVSLARTGPLLRPDITLITMVALEHRTHFRTLEAIGTEKGHLVEAIRPGGFALLNTDDPIVMAMRHRTKERIVTFGRRDQQADYTAQDITCVLPGTLTLKVHWNGHSIGLRTRFSGAHFWLPVLAAVATAIEIGLPPAVIAERVATFEPLLERGGAISVPGGPHFILDTNKAPWHSLPLAFDSVLQAQAPRKRIVLGHVADFSGSNDKRYRDAYRMARSCADQVIFIGEHRHRSKATAEDVATNVFASFVTPKEAFEYLRETAIPDEVILLKANSDLHLERLALAFVRELDCWTPRCGKKHSCLDCRVFLGPASKSNITNLADRPRVAGLG